MHEKTDQSYHTGTSTKQPWKLHSPKNQDHAPKKGNHHSLVAINSSYDSFIIDYGASHHMEKKEEFFSSLSPF
jgi:hypothetical protein